MIKDHIIHGIINIKTGGLWGITQVKFHYFLARMNKSLNNGVQAKEKQKVNDIQNNRYRKRPCLSWDGP